MSRIKLVRIMLLFFYAILCSCVQQTPKNVSDTGKNIAVSHAKGFEIIQHEGYKTINVFNPWQNAKDITYSYVLYNHKNDLPKGIKPDAMVNTPVKKVVCLSLTHIAVIDLLGKTNTIKGVSGAKYISNQQVSKQVEQGKTKDVGYDQGLNYEVVVSLKPDLVIAYGVTSEAANYINKLRELNIPVVINAEYLESSPLGKAEWMKFIAAFYDKEDVAAALFDSIEQQYNALVGLTLDIENKPVVLSSLPWKDTWYVPGGNSYFAKLIEDAGGRYLWRDNDAHESIPLAIETVIGRAGEADVWINTGTAKVKNDILKTDQRLKNIRPFKMDMVFNNNAKQNNAGGNEFWETGVVQPQVLLRDLIEIFHPGLLDHDLYYYHQLKSKH